MVTELVLLIFIIGFTTYLFRHKLVSAASFKPNGDDEPCPDNSTTSSAGAVIIKQPTVQQQQNTIVQLKDIQSQTTAATSKPSVNNDPRPGRTTTSSTVAISKQPTVQQQQNKIVQPKDIQSQTTDKIQSILKRKNNNRIKDTTPDKNQLILKQKNNKRIKNTTPGMDGEENRTKKAKELREKILSLIEEGKKGNSTFTGGEETDLGTDGEGISVYSSVPFASFISRCYHCLGPRTKARPLQRCSGCQLVSYCSKICQKDNFYMHKYFCKEFPVVDGRNCLYTKDKESWKEHISHLRERALRVQLRHDYLRKGIFATPRVCHTCHESDPIRLTDCSKCASVCYCSRRCIKADKKHMVDCSNIARREHKFSMHYMLQSYSQSVRYAFSFFKSFIEVTSINLHIISSCPMLDIEQWESIVMHSSPKLIHLNIVFIVQNRKYKPSKEVIAKNTQPICKDCQLMNRSLIYSVHKMPYHMYYSSEEYVEPNYVVIFGNTREMAANPMELKEDLNSDISYRNILNTPKTYLILFDETKDLVEQGFTTLDALDIPFTIIIKPRLNEYRAFSTLRAGLGLANEEYNDRMYFTMIRRSNPIEIVQRAAARGEL